MGKRIKQNELKKMSIINDGYHHNRGLYLDHVHYLGKGIKGGYDHNWCQGMV